MPYEELSNRNMSEAITLFKYVGDIAPMFYPLVLFVVFLIATFGIHFREKEEKGRSNMITCFMVAGWITSIFAIILSLIDLVNIFTVVVCIIITSVFVLISFTSQNK